MKEAEILERETRHLDEPEGWRTIHLYKQGKFLRAYNYSAFLLNRKSPAEIKATNAPTKTGAKVFAGFPEESAGKFLAIEGIQQIPDTEGNLSVVIPLTAFRENETVDALRTDCGNWMKCVPTPSKEPKTDSPTGTILSVVTEIVHYPVEQKSLLDNNAFLINIRQKLIKLI